MKNDLHRTIWKYTARVLGWLCLLMLLTGCIASLVENLPHNFDQSLRALDVFIRLSAFLPVVFCLWALCTRRGKGIRWGFVDVLWGLILLSGAALTVCGMADLPLSDMPTIFLVGPYMLCYMVASFLMMFPGAALLLLAMAGLILYWRKRHAA